MRRRLVLSITMVTLFFASVLIAQLLNGSDTLMCRDDGTIDPFDQLSVDSMTANPIAAVGHGAILNAEGEEIDVTPEFILEAQRFYLRSLFHQADEQQRLEFREKQAHLMQGTKCDEQGLVDVNFALIDWLIDEVQPENASGLASINTLLHATFATTSDELSPGQGASSTRMLEIPKQEGMQRLATELSGQAYIDECEAAGVPIPQDPIPTDWTRPPPGSWKYRGLLTTKFISQQRDAHVFTLESSSPRGICFALPRPQVLASGESIIDLLGIICQGSDTSKACFWDNQRDDRGFPIPKGTVTRLSEFAGGAALYGGTGGACTDCHAGENPFIVHPGTPLAQGPLLKPKTWHEPLVHPVWPQNRGPTTVLDGIASQGSCIACHTQSNPADPAAGGFPEVSRKLLGYCKEVLETAFSRTMPPGSPGDARYSNHIEKLRAECTKGEGELPESDPVDPGCFECKSIKAGNSPAESFMPCFSEGSECPRKKSVTFMLSEAAEVFIRYDLGQSHGCCADHMVGLLRILRDGTEVHRDTIPYFNYGVQPISEFLEDFDYFFPPEVVKGSVLPVSQLDSTRVGPRLESYKIVNRLSLGNLAAGSYTVELQVGDAGWNEVFEIYTLQ